MINKVIFYIIIFIFIIFIRIFKGNFFKKIQLSDSDDSDDNISKLDEKIMSSYETKGFRVLACPKCRSSDVKSKISRAGRIMQCLNCGYEAVHFPEIVLEDSDDEVKYESEEPEYETEDEPKEKYNIPEIPKLKINDQFLQIALIVLFVVMAAWNPFNNYLYSIGLAAGLGIVYLLVKKMM